MTTYERAVLTVLRSASKPMGWYQIEVRLSNMVLDERPLLVGVLSALRDQGLVMEEQAAELPNQRYSLTAAGLSLLESTHD